MWKCPCWLGAFPKGGTMSPSRTTAQKWITWYDGKILVAWRLVLQGFAAYRNTWSGQGELVCHSSLAYADLAFIPVGSSLDWDWGEQRAGDAAEDSASSEDTLPPLALPLPSPSVPPCQHDSDNMRYRLWRSTAKYLIWTIMPHHNCGAQITNSLLLASVHFAVSTNCTEELITTLMEGIPNGWCAVSCLGKSSLMRNKLRRQDAVVFPVKANGTKNMASVFYIFFFFFPF